MGDLNPHSSLHGCWLKMLNPQKDAVNIIFCLTGKKSRSRVISMNQSKIAFTAHRPLPKPRRLILIDIENFNGGPVATLAQAKWCNRVLKNWLRIGPYDQVIIAADATTLTNVFLVWPEARILLGRFQNGADRCLLSVMDEDLANRYTELLLVSGDRIFAEKVSELAAQGLATHVYSHASALSKRLRLAATTCITTPTSTTVTARFSPIRKVA